MFLQFQVRQGASKKKNQQHSIRILEDILTNQQTKTTLNKMTENTVGSLTEVSLLVLTLSFE